ncbi:MAG: branched-chain amino acid ABC transporter permease [Kiloniellales bacterium]
MWSMIVLFGAPNAMPKWWWWCFVGLASLVGLIIPSFTGWDVHLDLSIIFIFGMLALSMGFLWGFGGMLSFGQTAFFGLGGYTYAVWGLNFEETTFAMTLAVALPMVVALVLGYFMIYGRISAIYFTVITLVVTIVLEKAIRATSDERFVIGDVWLRGQNGISTVPDLQIPWDPGETFFVTGVYYVAFILMVLSYVGLRLLLTTPFGRVLVGIRENERRSALLGYDARRYKLMAFVLAGGLAGLSGGMYGVWGNFVAPEMMNLNSAASVVIYVIVGGKATLIGPLVGTGIVQVLTAWLGTAGVGQVNLILGLVMIAFVMIFPQGVLPSIGLAILYCLRRVRGAARGGKRPAFAPTDTALRREE